MISETLKKIETLISSAEHLSVEQRKNLETLLEKLKTELNQIPEENFESAISIAGFAEVATREALRTSKQQALVDISQSGLDTSVQEFAVSHPNLTGAVKIFLRTLSNLGV